MRFYKEQHQFYTGIDLHARTMYVCVMDNTGSIVYHKNMPSTPEALQHVISLYGTDNVIGVECIFTWYWIADFCSERSIPFALGHALYMKAIHGGKSKNDRIDSEKIAAMLRGGMFPLAHVYPKEMRATRDLLRRREYFVRHQAELFTHIENTNAQYNFISYCRLVKCAHESAGKKTGGGHDKIGNVHLKWEFSEAAVFFLRKNERAQKMHQKLVSKYGKGKALSLIAQKLGRTVYYMLKHNTAFEPDKFFQDGIAEPLA